MGFNSGFKGLIGYYKSEDYAFAFGVCWSEVPKSATNERAFQRQA